MVANCVTWSKDLFWFLWGCRPSSHLPIDLKCFWSEGQIRYWPGHLSNENNKLPCLSVDFLHFKEGGRISLGWNTMTFINLFNLLFNFSCLLDIPTLLWDPWLIHFISLRLPEILSLTLIKWSTTFYLFCGFNNYDFFHIFSVSLDQEDCT